MAGYSHRFLVEDSDEEGSEIAEEEASIPTNKKARAAAAGTSTRRSKKTVDAAHSQSGADDDDDAASSPLSTQTYYSDEPDECAPGSCKHRSQPFEDDAGSPAPQGEPNLRGIRCRAEGFVNGQKRRCRNWSHIACANIIMSTDGKGKHKRTVRQWQCDRHNLEHDFGQEEANDGMTREHDKQRERSVPQTKTTDDGEGSKYGPVAHADEHKFSNVLQMMTGPNAPRMMLRRRAQKKG
jgi:hypothetical protein